MKIQNIVEIRDELQKRVRQIYIFFNIFQNKMRFWFFFRFEIRILTQTI